MGFGIIALPSGSTTFVLSVAAPITTGDTTSGINNALGATIVSKFIPIPAPTIFQAVGGAQSQILLSHPISASGATHINDCFIGQSASSPAWGFVANTTARVTFGGSNSVTITNSNVLSDPINFSITGVAASVSFNIASNSFNQNTVLKFSGSLANYIVYTKAGVQEAGNPVSGSYSSVTKTDYIVQDIYASV